MKLIVQHLFRDLGKYYVTNFLNSIYHNLITLYPEYSFDIINNDKYEDNGYGGSYSCMNLSIINPNTEKYILISFFDNWRYLFMQHIGWNPQKMVRWFYCGGFNYSDYFYFRNTQKDNLDLYLPLNIDDIYHSFFYGPYYTDYEEEICEIYKIDNIRDSKDKLMFRGYMWDFRKDMTNELTDPSIIIKDKNTKNNSLNYLDYMKDLKKYRCALSLPGGTEVCNRDIECFSIGVPVIRPTLSVQYPDPLIPNYHYISCYDSCKYWDGNPTYRSYKDFQESLQDCWHRVKDDFDYLEFVAKNAREWYLKNCTLTQNIKYVLSKIDLEALNG